MYVIESDMNMDAVIFVHLAPHNFQNISICLYADFDNRFLS